MQKPQTLQGFKNIFMAKYETTPYGYCFVKLSSSDPVVEKRGKDPALKLSLMPLFLYKMEGVPVQLHPDMKDNTDNTIAEKLGNRNSSLITALAPQYNLSSRMMLEKAEKLYFERDTLVDKNGEEMVVAVRTRGQSGEELSDEEIEEEAEQAVLSIAKCFLQQGAELVDGLYEASVSELEKTLAVWKRTEEEIARSHYKKGEEFFEEVIESYGYPEKPWEQVWDEMAAEGRIGTDETLEELAEKVWKIAEAARQQELEEEEKISERMDKAWEAFGSDAARAEEESGDPMAMLKVMSVIHNAEETGEFHRLDVVDIAKAIGLSKENAKARFEKMFDVLGLSEEASELIWDSEDPSWSLSGKGGKDD